jgi:hypothetical protein
MQERERELARELRRRLTHCVLRAGHFERMRVVIPQWWEGVCTGIVAGDADIDALIDQRLAERTELVAAILNDWG